MWITKNSLEFCVLHQAQPAEVLGQIEGNSAPYSLQSQELQPYFHTDSSNLEH